MARSIEFSRRFTKQLLKVLTFYDERNGNDKYSRYIMTCLMEDIQRIALMPTIGSPSTRKDVRFFYLLDFTIIYRYNSKKISFLSIRSFVQKPLKIYQKK